MLGLPESIDNVEGTTIMIPILNRWEHRLRLLLVIEQLIATSHTHRLSDMNQLLYDVAVLIDQTTERLNNERCSPHGGENTQHRVDDTRNGVSDCGSYRNPSVDGDS